MGWVRWFLGNERVSHFGDALLGMRTRRSDVRGLGGVAGGAAELARVDPDGGAWGAQRHRLEGAGGAVVVAAARRPPRPLEAVPAARQLPADRLVLVAAAAAQRPGVRHQDATERLAELRVEDGVNHRVECAVRVAQPRQNLKVKNYFVFL